MDKFVFTISKSIGRAFHKYISPSGFFFFFPVAGMGGAETIHLRILEALPIKRSLIVFEISYKPDWLHRFKKYGRTWFADFYLQYSRFHRLRLQIFYAVISGAIEGHKNPKVFIADFTAYNRILINLSDKVWIADIVHAYVPDNIPELLRLDIAHRLNKRYLVSEHLVNETNQYYESHNLQAYGDRLIVIRNFVDIPPRKEFDTYNKEKHVLFLGREAEEKRIYLAGQIAKRLVEVDQKIKVIFIGPSSEAVHEDCRGFIDFKGLIDDYSIIREVLKITSVQIFTSTFEGLPLAFMEGMAHGVIPVSTAVGGIPFHIQNEQNGFLISEEDEEKIVSEAVDKIIEIFGDPTALQKLSENAYEYARTNFTRVNYDEAVLNFFEEL